MNICMLNEILFLEIVELDNPAKSSTYNYTLFNALWWIYFCMCCNRWTVNYLFFFR